MCAVFEYKWGEAGLHAELLCTLTYHWSGEAGRGGIDECIANSSREESLNVVRGDWDRVSAVYTVWRLYFAGL